MTTQEVLQQLEALAQESIKKTMMRHGVQEPLYGVKIEELKKIQKKIKKDYHLSLKLYATGIYDAMYLAGLIAEPEKMEPAQLQQWAALANAPILRETVTAGIAAESRYGAQMASEWINSPSADMVCTGWATWVHIVSIKDDSELDTAQLKQLLQRVAKNIHQSPNRVKYNMNAFVIATGAHVKDLTEAARQTAHTIGKVTVDMGDTACKVPPALEYIDRSVVKGSLGKKRKSTIC